jgi:drug/metabolite transporter (DMT)-like permease
VVSDLLARPHRATATLALVGATAVWGSTFVVTKEALPHIGGTSFITWRFGVAAVVLVACRPRRVVELDPRSRRHAIALGALVGLGFLLQTEGLRETPAGVSGFLTGTSVLLTPVVASAFFRERVGPAGWGAVVMCTAGLTMLVGGAGSWWSAGVLLTMAGAACFAGHIAGLSQWATPANAYGLTTWTVATAAVVCGLVSGLTTGLESPASSDVRWAVAYLALGATCLGFVVQAWAQSALTATSAAVVMTLEPVFAAGLAAAFVGERLTLLAWCGGLIVVSSMFVAELGPRQCCDAMSPRIECC